MLVKLKRFLYEGFEVVLRSCITMREQRRDQHKYAEPGPGSRYKELHEASVIPRHTTHSGYP